MNEFKIVKFVGNSFEIDVRTDINNETVWLIQKEMVQIKMVIGKLLSGIFKFI